MKELSAISVSADPGLEIDRPYPVVEVEHLFKSFGGNRVLNDFSLTLYEQENLVVMGKSGSGKSVLIKCSNHIVQRTFKSNQSKNREYNALFGKDITNPRLLFHHLGRKVYPLVIAQVFRCLLHHYCGYATFT